MPLEVARVPIVVVSVLMNAVSVAEAARVCGGRESVVEVTKLLALWNFKTSGLRSLVAIWQFRAL